MLKQLTLIDSAGVDDVDLDSRYRYVVSNQGPDALYVGVNAETPSSTPGLNKHTIQAGDEIQVTGYSVGLLSAGESKTVIYNL